MLIKIQELQSDCARRVLRMRQRDWEEKERWDAVGCGRRDLTAEIFRV